MIQHKSSQSGFTLVEAAIVVVIGGILIAAGAAMLTSYMQSSRIAVTKQRMQDIDNAIIQYLNVNGVLPCVASMTSAQDSAPFGVEVTAIIPTNIGKDCLGFVTPGNEWTTTGVTPPPQPYPTNTATTAGATTLAPTLAPNGPGYIIMGAVPVRTLNLPDQDIADAWGNRFSYTVTDALTISSPATEYDQTQGAISVEDSNGFNIAPSGIAAPTPTNPAAQYVIVSYGADGAGSYTLAGVANGVPCPPAPALENTNCTYPTATFRTTLLNSFQAGIGYFDDYVLFHSLIASTGTVPTGLVAPFATQTCPTGWTAYGSPATGPFYGGPICSNCGNAATYAGQPACNTSPPGSCGPVGFCGGAPPQLPCCVSAPGTYVTCCQKQ